jgi:thioredoxin reductase (NADPH)
VTAPEPGQLAETPDLYGAFPRLSEAQIETLAAHGHRRRTHPGEVLFREGDPGCDFFVILAGKVAIMTGYGGDEHVISVHGPGRFLASSACSPGRPSS